MIHLPKTVQEAAPEVEESPDESSAESLVGLEAEDPLEEEKFVIYPNNVGFRRFPLWLIMENSVNEERDAPAEEPLGVGIEALPKPECVAMQVGVPRRNYPPPQHDVIGDGIHRFFNILLAKGLAIEISHLLSYSFACEADNHSMLPIRFQEIPFVHDIYLTEDTETMKKMFDAPAMLAAANNLLQKLKKASGVLQQWSGLYVSGDQLNGTPYTQNDRLIAYPNRYYMDQQRDDVALIGVFTGHGGHRSSEYVASHLFEEWIKIRDSSELSQLSLEKALVLSMTKTDERLMIRSEKEGLWPCGATGICMAINAREKEIALAWTGNTPVFFLSGHTIRTVHRRNRLKNKYFAPFGYYDSKNQVVFEPESSTINYAESDFLIILASDGVHNVLSAKQLYDFIEKFVTLNQLEDYWLLARALCAEAIRCGSDENVTIALAFLRRPEDLWTFVDYHRVLRIKDKLKKKIRRIHNASSRRLFFEGFEECQSLLNIFDDQLPRLEFCKISNILLKFQSLEDNIESYLDETDKRKENYRIYLHGIENARKLLNLALTFWNPDTAEIKKVLDIVEASSEDYSTKTSEELRVLYQTLWDAEAQLIEFGIREKKNLVDLQDNYWV